MNEWLDISTAPKDGTRILLVSDGYCVKIGVYDDDRYAKKPRPYWRMSYRVTDDKSRQPTHWIPLPDFDGVG